MNVFLKRHVSLRVLACLAGALFAVGSAGAAELQVFTVRSFADIRQASADRPLVVAFWSTTCAPCAEEMSVLARLHRTYPAVRVVLVAADGPELRPKVERFLERYALDSLETWQFGDDAEERLRYAVDHAWRGELPRAYFFSATGETSVKSGVPEESWLTDWFKQANAVAAPPAP